MVNKIVLNQRLSNVIPSICCIRNNLLAGHKTTFMIETLFMPILTLTDFNFRPASQSNTILIIDLLFGCHDKIKCRTWLWTVRKVISMPKDSLIECLRPTSRKNEKSQTRTSFPNISINVLNAQLIDWLEARQSPDDVSNIWTRLSLPSSIFPMKCVLQSDIMRTSTCCSFAHSRRLLEAEGISEPILLKTSFIFSGVTPLLAISRSTAFVRGTKLAGCWREASIGTNSGASSPIKRSPTKLELWISPKLLVLYTQGQSFVVCHGLLTGSF